MDIGDKFDLPDPISTHNSYWLWGPGDKEGDLVILLGGDIKFYLDVFEQVEKAAVFTCDYCMPYENNLPIYIARNLKIPINQLWPEIKHYDQDYLLILYKEEINTGFSFFY